MAYTVEFRRHVLKVRAEEKLSDRETARRFCLALSSIKRWKTSIESPGKNRRNRKTRIDMEALARDVELHPDDYQYERAQRFAISTRGICAALKRLNISRKKNSGAPEGR